MQWFESSPRRLLAVVAGLVLIALLVLFAQRLLPFGKVANGRSVPSVDEKLHGSPAETASEVNQGEEKKCVDDSAVLALSTHSVPLSDSQCIEVATVLASPSTSDTIRNEAANLLRRSRFPDLTDGLLMVLDNPAEKPRFRSFAVQHLWHQLDGAGKENQDRIRAKLHELIADLQVEVRREALLALVRMRDPVGQTTAISWLTSKEPSAETTRDLAIRCVHDLGLREQIPMIRSYARDPNEVTQIAAIVALSQWGDEDSREAFKAAADSSSTRLQRAGKAALGRLDQQGCQPPMASTDGAPKKLPDEGAK